MSAIFESLKQLDEKIKASPIVPDAKPPQVERKAAAPSSKWAVYTFVVFGLAWLGWAIFTHIQHQKLTDTLSSQHTSFVGRFDQLDQDIDELNQRLASAESSRQEIAARLNRLTQEVAKERGIRSEWFEKQSQEISMLQTQLDERLNLLSQRIGVVEETVSQPGQEER